MAKKYIAIYLRLSLEDDVEERSSRDESDSITSQREIVLRYIQEHEELQQYSIMEFIDDGYSGTNFDRPNIQKLLNLVREGKIQIIIVKDLSRFGRNYLEVGDYLEHLFPYLNVRFIAVNDHYDSNAYIGTTAGIDVAFKNFVHEQYSRDLSLKVKASQHMMMRKGKYVTHCPYGYTKEPGVKHQMIPDPITAPIVREIFLMAISGKKTTEIARTLNDRNIPTPQTYKKWVRKDTHNKSMWSHQAVLRIIKDYKYTGAMVNFKCENLTIRAKAQHRRKPEEYLIIEDVHRPIVSHEEYYAANDSLRKVKTGTVVPTDRRDRIYYCGHCGRRLRKTFGADEYYSCATQMYIEDAVCRSIRWSRTDIENIVFSAYKKHLEFLMSELKKAEAGNPHDILSQLRADQQALERLVKSSDSDTIKLYEKYRSGSISRERFIEQKAICSEQKKNAAQQLEKLNKEIESELRKRSERLQQADTIRESIKVLEFSDDEMRTHMYEAIDMVVVYADSEIEIKWKFSCDFEKTEENK